MSANFTINRYNVSPAMLEELREHFSMVEYFQPRQYKNASRYKNLRLIQDPKSGKKYHENWFRKIIDESNEDTYITVTKAEENRLDMIANTCYNTPRFWWVIAIANDLIDPFEIPIGTTLRIPPILSLYNEGGILSGR